MLKNPEAIMLLSEIERSKDSQIENLENLYLKEEIRIRMEFLGNTTSIKMSLCENNKEKENILQEYTEEMEKIVAECL